ncbi:PIN domain-containing protein [Oscillatoria amoena NRMC-F 0135]|nr:PIN domain-containing protein [Oscillatoria amoena NRMC-F 0135]
MKPSYCLDANVVIRFLLNDHPEHSPLAKKVFDLAAIGKIKLHIPHMIIAEVVWVLGSHYKIPREALVGKLLGLIHLKGVAVPEPPAIISALEQFARVNVDFVDCYLAAVAQADELKVLSFDADFGKLPGIGAVHPSEVHPPKSG